MMKKLLRAMWLVSIIVSMFICVHPQTVFENHVHNDIVVLVSLTANVLFCPKLGCRDGSRGSRVVFSLNGRILAKVFTGSADGARRRSHLEASHLCGLGIFGHTERR